MLVVVVGLRTAKCLFFVLFLNRAAIWQLIQTVGD
jgi:hypothetical protein